MLLARRMPAVLHGRELRASALTTSSSSSPSPIAHSPAPRHLQHYLQPACEPERLRWERGRRQLSRPLQQQQAAQQARERAPSRLGRQQGAPASRVSRGWPWLPGFALDRRLRGLGGALGAALASAGAGQGIGRSRRGGACRRSHTHPTPPHVACLPLTTSTQSNPRWQP